MACLEKKIPLILVSNPSLLNVNSDSLGLERSSGINQRIPISHARNYVEAAGLLMALREGIAKDSLYRPIKNLVV